MRGVVFSVALVLAVPHMKGDGAKVGMKLSLPTENQAIFKGKPEDFYQFVERNYKGELSYPWEGGQYGFVRTPVETPQGLVYKQFHEGLDIKPVRRDAKGEPLDVVMSMAPGRVVHVSDAPRSSNYGRYIVVEHQWGDGPIYSLYAHLATTSVKVGDSVKAGDVIGKMGYTGAGINKERAHTHVEQCLMLSSRFNEWMGGSKSKDADGLETTVLNKHGIYNGLNLIGMDLCGALKACYGGRVTSVPEFLSSMRPYYKVVVPRHGELEIAQRYPWLRKGGDDPSPSWEISLAGSGFPLAIEPCQVKVGEPNVSAVVDSAVPHYYRTKGYLTGSGTDVRLTSSGLRYIRLLTGDF